MLQAEHRYPLFTQYKTNLCLTTDPWCHYQSRCPTGQQLFNC